MIDERAHAGAEHLDREYVAAYDRKAGLDPADELAFLQAHGLRDDTTLVDLGAGTGVFALAAAPLCRRVVAVDVSPAMIAYLRRQADERGISNVECVRAGFLSYTHEGAAADIVYSRNALHHLPDFWKGVALARVHDLLAPGGTFLLRDLVYPFEPHEAPAQLEDWFAGATTDAGAGWTRDELETHVRDEHSTYAWLLEPLLLHAGLAIDDVSHRGVHATYVCSRA